MPKVKHVAFLKFKEGTSPDQVDGLFDSILDITENVDGIEDYVSGENSSPEGLNKGYSHSFIITFQDAAARDAYLAHPEHDKLKNQLLPHLEDIVVCDFEI